MPEFGLAGAEIMCETLCNKLKGTKQYNVIVVSLYDYHSPITERLEANGITVLYLHKKKGVDISLFGKLLHIMRNYQIMIVHTHRYVMQYAIPAAIIAKVPIRVHTVHNIAEKEFDRNRRKLAFLFYKYCHVIPVSISPEIKESVKKEYRIKHLDSPIVYNGTDLELCEVKESYMSCKPFRFIHIGRFCTQKNQTLILNSISQLKKNGLNIHIDLIGEGDEESHCREMVKRLGIEKEVSFCGLTNNVFTLLKKSDCFILPSLYEGMPVSLVEAMGCGLPIIATRVGGIPDMIEDGVSGILIEATIDSLTHSMTMVVDDFKLRSYLGHNALERSRLFSADKMLEGYVRVYNWLGTLGKERHSIAN